MSTPSLPTLTPAEQDACVVLSDLFLDLPFSQTNLDNLAHVLHSFRIPTPELAYMLEHYLFPLLYPNLLLTDGGVFTGWERESLLEQIARSRQFRQNAGMLYTFAYKVNIWVMWALVGHHVWSPWKEIKRRIDQNP